MKIEINKLTPHPLNLKVYGEDDNVELIEKIKNSGWIKPILITNENQIISGHRRVDSCKALGIKEIDYELVEGDYIKLLEIFIGENQYRQKAPFQLMREAQVYIEIETKKAYQRQTEIGKQNLRHSSVEANLPQPIEETGRVTEIVAKKIGMGETTFKKGKKVMDYVDEHPDTTFLFEPVMNDSVDKSFTLTKKSPDFIAKVKNRSNGDKDKVLEALKEIEREETVKIPLPTGRFDLIINDLTQQNIDKMLSADITSIAYDNCILLMWVTPAILESGMKIGKKWGFKYRTCLAWNKDVLNEFSENCEILLVFIKGNPSIYFKDYAGSVEKPSSFSEMIYGNYSDVDKVIILADGWKMW
jgi:hypothetical protein